MTHSYTNNPQIAMPFHHWLLTQPVRSLPCGPQGDFVLEAKSDRAFPEVQTWPALKSYLRNSGACREAVVAAAGVWRFYQRKVRRMHSTLNHWDDGRVECPPLRVGSLFGPDWSVLRDRIIAHNTRSKAERLAVTLPQLATHLGVSVGCIKSEATAPVLGPRLGPQLFGNGRR